MQCSWNECVDDEEKKERQLLPTGSWERDTAQGTSYANWHFCLIKVFRVDSTVQSVEKCGYYSREGQSHRLFDILSLLPPRNEASLPTEEDGMQSG